MPFKCKKRERGRQAEKYQRVKKEKPFWLKCVSLKGTAKIKGIAFDLTPEYLELIWNGRCYISDTTISFHTDRSSEHHAELDRIIPERGYTQGNVAWISRRFNRLKSDGTVEEHRLIAERIDTLRKEYGNGSGNASEAAT